MHKSLTIVLAGLLAFASGCHRRTFEGREAPAPEPVAPAVASEQVSTTTTTGAELSKEAWGPLPAAPASEPLVAEPQAPAAQPTTAPTAAQPAPIVLPPPVYVMPSEQEPEPPKRVGPPSAADRNTWAGSVAQ